MFILFPSGKPNAERQVFTKHLNDAKAERARVNRAFVLAHEGTSPAIIVAPTPVEVCRISRMKQSLNKRSNRLT